MTDTHDKRHAVWYFDVVSPFAYLQLKAHMPRLKAMMTIRPVPLVLGAVLAHWGQKGPAEITPKRLHTYRAAQFRAHELGIPFHFPPAHPFNPIAALRAIVALGGDWPVVEAVFDAVWLDRLDLGGAEGMDALSGRLGVADLAERMRSDAVKQTLRANGEAALAAGVFGVPTIVVDGEIFWGEDTGAMLAAFLADPQFFRRGEMAALDAIPIGVVRKP